MKPQLEAKTFVRRLLRRLGVDVIRYAAPSHPRVRQIRILDWLGIELVVDVGANCGQYGRDLREHGYRGRIISFEPLSGAFAELSAFVHTDPAWQAFPFALGEEESTKEINVAENSVSSSLREMLPLHLDALPSSGYARKEEIRIRRLDRVLSAEIVSGVRTLLKVDTQGYELPVLRGAGNLLGSFAAIELEVSLAPLYAGAMSLEQTLRIMADWSFQLVNTEPEFGDSRTGRLLQMNGTFARADLIS